MTGEIINDDEQEIIEEAAISAPEGTPGVDPTSAEVKSLYEDLGITAPVPTGATKGRPKSTDVRAKNDTKNGAGNPNSGKKEEDLDDEGKPKNAPASDKDGDSRNNPDKKGSEVGKDSKKVSDKPEEADGGVRKTESDGEGDAERGREESAEQRAERLGQEAHDKGSEAEEEELDEEGVKRPGKSNPAVEARMQRLAAERKEALERAEAAEKKLQEATLAQEQSKIDQKDPEYKVEDFKKVRDDEGNILDLTDDEAELAYRRWKDGYDQRKTERDAEVNRQVELKEYQEKAAREVMESSVAAYDTLTGLLESYPQLNSKLDDGTDNPDFDKEFSDQVMPIIEDAIIYQQGTEPGNEEKNRPVIIGLRVDPTKILSVMHTIRSQKPTLPLNGLSDNVEVRSNKNVPHGSRSSDPNVAAANELYRSLNINKRL